MNSNPKHYYHLKAAGRFVIATEAESLEKAMMKAGVSIDDMLWADEDGITVWECFA